MKKTYIVLFVCLIVGIGIVALLSRQKPITPTPQMSDPKNTTYTIDGSSVTLVNGISQVPIASGSAESITTRYFGNDAQVDLDGDGRMDTVFLLTQSRGGSGTFYYIVGALNTPQGYVGSHGLLIGDRIAPQTTEISKNEFDKTIVTVNYADRKPGESFAIQPSLGKSLRLIFDPTTSQFGEVVSNFEGEADPARMKLNMKTWNWQSTQYNNDTKITPKVPQKFTLTFKSKDTFGATTDCNGVGGEYSITQNKIAFKNIVSTLMYCEGSQEQDFTKMLNQISSYHFTSKGELVFDLAFDSGVMVFK